MGEGVVGTMWWEGRKVGKAMAHSGRSRKPGSHVWVGRHVSGGRWQAMGKGREQYPPPKVGRGMGQRANVGRTWQQGRVVGHGHVWGGA